MSEKKIKILDKQTIVSETKSTRSIAFLSIFGLVGIVPPVVSFFAMLLDFNTNSIITFLFLCLFPGLVFGYFIFWRNVEQILKDTAILKGGHFWIVKDIIVDKRIRSDADDTYYYLTLEYFGNVFGRETIVSHTMYKSAKMGMPVYTVYTRGSKYPYVYLSKNYDIADELQDKMISSQRLTELKNEIFPEKPKKKRRNKK